MSVKVRLAFHLLRVLRERFPLLHAAQVVGVQFEELILLLGVTAGATLGQVQREAWLERSFLRQRFLCRLFTRIERRVRIWNMCARYVQIDRGRTLEVRRIQASS